MPESRIQVIRCFDEEDMKEMLEDLQGKGMRCQAYRSGYLLSYPAYRGKVWVHVLLALWSWGILNLVYLAVLSRRKRDSVYVRMASGVPTKVSV